MSENTDPADQLRRQIQSNTTNMGELGRFIRVEHVYAILDHFTIVDQRGVEQSTRIAAVRIILRDTGADAAGMRTALERIYRAINP